MITTQRLHKCKHVEIVDITKTRCVREKRNSNQNLSKRPNKQITKVRTR